MGYLGEEIKKLGFGLMRLPKKGDEIDVEQTKEMVDLFLEAGFTYLIPLGLIMEAKLLSVRHWSNVIPGKAISLPQKMRLGSSARQKKKLRHSWNSL